MGNAGDLSFCRMRIDVFLLDVFIPVYNRMKQSVRANIAIYQYQTSIPEFDNRTRVRYGRTLYTS